jgi:hypothetical protein
VLDHPEDGHVPDDAPAHTPTDEGAQSARRPRSDSGTDDWLLRALERVEEAGQLAAAALARSLDNVSEIRRQREGGTPVDSIIGRMVATGGPEARRATEDAFHRYQHAVMVLRALTIRALVDSSGSTLSEVARAMNISRQKVTQLYRIGASISETADEE